MSKIDSHITSLSYDPMAISAPERIQSMYFNWLLVQVCLDYISGRSYFVLAKLLHRYEFYWTNELDENRAKDGIRLRHIWHDSINDEAASLGVASLVGVESALSGPCSVLEMLVALAIRIETDIMQEDTAGNRVRLWFWKMLGNLGIAQFDDDHLTGDMEATVREAVTRMMERKYDQDGLGGALFWLRTPNHPDMRGLDIWWQAQLWLAEEYPNEGGIINGY